MGRYPTLLSEEDWKLRYRLISEELDEYLAAVMSEDLTGVGDAIADLLYVVYGTAVAHGIDADELLREVHRSNMTKLDANGNPVPHPTIPGKVGKSHRFQEPQIASLLFLQTLRAQSNVE